LADKIALERIWAFHAGPMVGYFVGREEVGTNVAEYVRADIVEALRADLARAVDALGKCEDIQRRVQQDTYWRSPDNTLWPDLCDNTNCTRTIIASIKERDNG